MKQRIVKTTVLFTPKELALVERTLGDADDKTLEALVRTAAAEKLEDWAQIEREDS